MGPLQSVIDNFVARGVFNAKGPQVGRDGVPTWQVLWFGGHVMAFTNHADETQVAPLLPALDARSRLYRDLRSWLIAQQSDELPPYRRLDPAQYALTLRNRGGAVSLSVRTAVEPAERLRQTVRLVHAMYVDFLNGPGRLDWVTEAFGLDPDNPRLC